MVLSIMVPHFPGIGSGGMPPVPPTIIMSGLQLSYFSTPKMLGSSIHDKINYPTLSEGFLSFYI